MNTYCLSRALSALIILSTLLLSGQGRSQESAGTPVDQTIRDLLDRECINLNKERLYALVTTRFGEELADPSPDLLRIMEGVIKRTDFDGIPEEKSVEIIGLVHGAFQKGAPLEFLDDVFDVAYARTITVDQLTAAANALRDFHNSAVPQDIYEEFVYHSIEDEWDPRATPVLVRGLIYGVDRGLSPEKVALIIMLDVKNEEMKEKTPEQLVLDAVKLVREKEPQKWKPMTPVERETLAKQARVSVLARQQQEIDADLQQKERAFLQAQRELKELREYPANKAPDIDVEKINQDLELLIRKLQAEIAQHQNRRGGIVAELETARREIDRQQAVRDRKRQQQREQDLVRAQQHITTRGRQGRLDRDRLQAAVNQLLGTPYRFGGDSELGIDCSAFTRRVYRSQGVELPRTSRDQARVGSGVAHSGLRTGDLVFFNTSINGVISHVGVYLGSGVFAHSSSSKGVTKSSIRERYYVKRFVKGGRIFND
jgi:cell wall-associated NlpC family hydrolase